MLTQLRRVLLVLALPLIAAGLVATAYAYHDREPQAPQSPSETAGETVP
jgi:hypothetical protein